MIRPADNMLAPLVHAAQATHKDKIVAVASGERTRSEDLGFGGAEFVPWQIGAVM